MEVDAASKKRKLRHAEEEREDRKPSKAPRTDRVEKEERKRGEDEKELKEVKEELVKPAEKLEAAHPWRNLQLILSLQNKDIAIHKKVELAFNYVKFIQNGDDNNEDLETVSISRVIVFLNNWVQSLLISSEKKIRAEQYRPQPEIVGSLLDSRCWEIFKYCLEESLKLHVPLNVLRDFLRVIHCIARDILSRLDVVPVHAEEIIMTSSWFDLYSTVNHCVLLVFSSPIGVLNENLELWNLTAIAVLELVQRIIDHNLDGCNSGVLVLELACVMLEPFAKFLRIHPNKKNGFRDFVDKLLEPLLHLLNALCCRVHDSDPGWMQKLLKIIEEVLSHGLFHPAHMDGLLSLQSTGRYITLENRKPVDSSSTTKSYHRHLFDKLEKFWAGKNVLALSGIGEMFHVFVKFVKRQKGASLRGGLMSLENGFFGHMPKSSFENNKIVLEDNHFLSSLNAETRKSILDFFVQIVEPWLQELNLNLQGGPEVWPALVDFGSTLSSTNKIIVSFLHEKLYIRTEDISEGAFFNFLKLIYDSLLSLSFKIIEKWSSTIDRDKPTEIGVLNSIAKELVHAVGCLIEIDYEVVGNDLKSLWFVIFSFAALGLSLPPAPDQHSVTTEILHLGRQLVNLYSELRQVNTVIFSLCDVARSLTLPNSHGEVIGSEFKSGAPVLYRGAYAKAVSMVLCAQEVRLAIYNAVVSISGGQVSGCIQQLKTDILESLEWIRDSCPFVARNELGKLDTSASKLYFDMQAELLGRGLCDMYTLVMDSLSVTAGNSNLLRFSMEELMTILRLKMKSLVAIDPGSVNKFFSTVTGRTQSDNKTERKNDFVSMHWILLFFFRLYMSCRSLYRQVLSLVPIDTSRRMSAAMCDSIAAFSGNDWLERTDWTCGGYFSWIIEPSASLVTVIQSISDIYLEDAAAADCSPLVYVLNAMAIQRLLDLNRLIKSFEYLLQKNEYLIQTRLIDDTGFSSNSQKPNSNNIRRWKECILSLRQEAADLTNFMMGHLLSLPKKQMSTPSYTNYKNLDIHTLPAYDTCHFVVGAINEKSLPSALLWITCQSIDVWCSHAAKKKLKLFLSLILRNFLLRVGSSSDEFAAQKPAKARDLENIVAHEMSFELLKDTVFYEQRLVRRHMASTFCRILEKSVLAIFSNAGKVYSKSSPNWSEFLSMLDESLIFTGDNLVMDESTSVAESASCYSKRQSIKCCREQKSRVSHMLGFADCICLLNLLCWMPKGYLNSKSFSICATCIINIERLVVGSLLDCQDAVYWQNFHELLKLFLSCRRALKNLIIGCCEEMGAGQSSIAVILFQSSSPVLWLLKSLSAVFVAQQSYSEDSASQVKNVIFSLMDHTSNVLLAISKDQFILAVQCLVNGNPCEEENVGSVVNGAILHKGNTLVDSELSSESTKNIDAWNTMVLVAETLKEQMDLLFSRIKAECNTGMQTELGVIALNNLSAVVSCSQGFWWGLASALGQIDSDKCNVKTEVSRREHEPMLKLMCCIDAFAEFVNYYVHALLIEDDKCPDSFCDDQTRPLSDGVDDVPGVEESLWEDSGDVTENEHRSFGTLNSFSRSSDNKDHSGKKVRKKRSRSENANSRDNMFSKCDSFELCRLKKSILQGFVRGEHPEAAFFLRELFIASSVLLRLNLQINCASLSLSSVPIFASIAQILLMEMEKEAKFSSPYSSVWFDGITKFFEELASHFPLSNPVLSGNAYVKMIELHLMAIGKCITLQGKRANLASHDTESRTKTLNLKMKLSGSTLSFGEYCLDGFKARLRMSFKAFIKTPSELHLLAALQALERALVGVRVGCTINYEIFIGSSDGGKVSSLVAAGIDCMDLVLEFVTGRKRLNVVKRHIQNSVSCLFNIMLHLQGPSIFYRNIVSNKGNANPDPGSVILMCVEVLTRVVGKHDIYQLDSCQLGQSLRIPAVLFQNILQLRHSGAPDTHQWDNQDAKISDNKNFCDVDWEFSVDLYAACCRLLSTVIKHHKRESERCVALLEDSVSVLLHCLEMVNITASVRKQHFAWETLEAVKCASFLRRIYEELRQQKDFFGRHCSLFLSSYIWTYSGYGPLKNGIRREIDEALRPGVYALIDACSADDLQHLHTVFGGFDALDLPLFLNQATSKTGALNYESKVISPLASVSCGTEVARVLNVLAAKLLDVEETSDTLAD